MFRSAFNALRPGGYLELHDAAPFKSIDGSDKGTAFEKWTKSCLEGVAKLGRKFDRVSWVTCCLLLSKSWPSSSPKSAALRIYVNNALRDTKTVADTRIQILPWRNRIRRHSRNAICLPHRYLGQRRTYEDSRQMEQSKRPGGYSRLEHDVIDKRDGNDVSRGGRLTCGCEERDQLREGAYLHAYVSIPSNDCSLLKTTCVTDVRHRYVVYGRKPEA